ncbi:hypothetical protein [Deinococcus sp.]|uniref:hypothetical protein n=1 Tax=Deinococcus sp. TaxID=47478 RepID=UPI0025E697EC|nr:hypothetical protein [Deinococcus sp.]
MMVEEGVGPELHTIITREEITGVEFDWFARDAAGHIGQFLAVGDSSVPQAALASEEWLERLHVALDTLPEREAVNAPAGGFDLHLAGPQQRGAYVYEALAGQPGHYRLVAWPHTPLRVSELSAELQTYLGTLTLDVALGTPRLFIGADGAARVVE